MAIQLDDLNLLEQPLPASPSASPAAVTTCAAVATEGVPLSIPIETVEEDPEQPRREFDATALQELADSIAQRGVLQAVSVRPLPDKPGRWMLNFGARRLRASRLAGLNNIPAFVDARADRYDQVIENEQREGLRPLDLALFVQQRLALGETQAEIARRLGKSGAYVNYVCALIDPPSWLMQLYREGRCRGVKELYDLRRLHEKAGGAVEAMLAEKAFVARADLDALRASVAAAQHETKPQGLKTQASATSSTNTTPTPTDAARQSNQRQAQVLCAATAIATPVGRVALMADCRGRAVEVLLARPTDLTGFVCVRADDSEVASVSIADLSGLRLQTS